MKLYIAICALSPSSENCYIAYPSSSSSTSPFAPTTPTTPTSTTHSSLVSGDVEIFDALGIQLVNIVQAHKTPVSCITMNSEGTLLATASEKGTVIRVFSVPDASKVYQFRRGSYPAKIYSMSFNLVSSLLCVSSDTETVHIFKIAAGGNPGHSTENGSSLGYDYNNNNGGKAIMDHTYEDIGNRGRSGSVG